MLVCAHAHLTRTQDSCQFLLRLVLLYKLTVPVLSVKSQWL